MKMETGRDWAYFNLGLWTGIVFFTCALMTPSGCL